MPAVVVRARAASLFIWGSILFFGSLVCLVATDEPPVHLPEDFFPLLEQILRDSVDSSWRMVEEGLRVEEARAEATVAAAGRYPSVRGTLRYSGRLEDREDFEGTRSLYQPQATLIARQPLYHWGALRARDRVGRLRAAMADGDRAEAYLQLALGLRAAFLELAVLRRSVALAERREDLAGQELSIARARFEREEITAEALREQELAAAETKLALRRWRREREFAIRDFCRLSGFEPVGQEWVPQEIPALSTGGDGGEGPPDGGARPWEEVSRLRIRQAEEELAVESARRRPRLDLVAGVAQDQVAVLNRSDIDRIVYFAGVELTWNLFDGHETRGRRQAALARQRLETRRHQRQEREWADELARLEETLDRTARELALAEERLELAERDLSQREEDLVRGLISEAEAAAARVAHAERELSANNRRAEYLMAVAEWRSRAGTDPAIEHYLSRQR